MTRALILDTHADWYAARLGAACPGVSVAAATTPGAAMEAAPGAEILIGMAGRLSPELIAAAPGLKWVQALTTGVDPLLKPGVLPAGVALTNCRGIHGPQMSELAILMMLAGPRRFARMLDNQRAARWESWPMPLLEGKTVCLLGLGAIAERLAAVCAAFGMEVTGVSDGRRAAPGVARIFPRARLAEAAAGADFLVVLTPYEPATHHIVDAGVLAAMKPGAMLINLARGLCVDEDALLAALHEGRIIAGLDVFGQEPLPEDSPLWSAPGAILTPHVGGLSDIYRDQAAPLVEANLAAYLSGGVAALSNRIARD
ncbi:D-2-hydroxyacid dehydrogenase [Rhodovulum sp. DZ06]|uniref:D-2-hydroxyacid dehydrogenase n=1 Tax=Rhodovulum sp. DZ06 TaxID=3425126 RepID=UPI003D34126E